MLVFQSLLKDVVESKFFKEDLLESQPALIVPLPAEIVRSPALNIPLSDKFFVNRSPSKETPKVPYNILRNPPLCSLASF